MVRELISMRQSVLMITCTVSVVYCKSFRPNIRGLDPRVPPGSVLLYSTVKVAPERGAREM